MVAVSFMMMILYIMYLIFCVSLVNRLWVQPMVN